MSEDFWSNLKTEIESLNVNFKASDMRRFKASLKDKVFAFETGAEIREKLLVWQQKEIEKLQADLALAKEGLEYIKASHRCICSKDKFIPCSRCEADKILAQLDKKDDEK